MERRIVNRSGDTVRRAAAAAVLLVAGTAGAATVGSCRFDVAARRFAGTPVEQAQCLLRTVAKWGKVSATPAVLPESLAAVIGEPVGFSREGLRMRLAAAGLDEAAVGGSLDKPVSARYFVIHDTSAPWLGNAVAFPPDDAPALNALTQYKKPDAAAHVFVNRIGQTLLGHDFAEPWRATKLESKVIGAPARGLFVHVELLQPRRRDSAGSPKNDALAPTPGFTPVQYERLSLLYAAASVRAGIWLVPAFHASIDEGLANAHDDPQNFVLTDFAVALARLLQALGGAATVAAETLAVVTAAGSDNCASIVSSLSRLNDGGPLLASGCIDPSR